MKVKRVLIYYSSGEEHIFCFWNNFFKACGIWVVEKTRDEVWNQSSSDTPVLFILGNSDIELIQRICRCKHAYIVKKNATFNFAKSREDVVINSRGGKNNNDKVLRLIFSDTKDADCLYKLLDIFENYQLCGMMWIFHEVAMKNKSDADTIIKDAVNRIIDRIKEDKILRGNWHSKFMALYCEYIDSGVKTKNLIERTFLCQELRRKCEMLAKEKGWLPSLCVLTGDILRLSSAEGKLSVNFYKHATLLENSADILYEIGRIYEDMYGEKARAMDYYISAYSVNTLCYRANYKIAFDAEQAGNWKRALRHYQEMFFWLRERKKSVSVYELLYLYKINRRILSLCKKYTSSQIIVEFYTKTIEEFWELLDGGNCFNALLHCMFKKEQRSEIRDILSKEVERAIDAFYFSL